MIQNSKNCSFCIINYISIKYLCSLIWLTNRKATYTKGFIFACIYNKYYFFIYAIIYLFIYIHTYLFMYVYQTTIIGKCCTLKNEQTTFIKMFARFTIDTKRLYSGQKKGKSIIQIASS